jgi:hypothetical protein
MAGERHGTLILMNARLRRLFEPAPTSPTDPFKWNDMRPKAKQVASGFRIAAGLIVGFAVMVMVVGSFRRLLDGEPQSFGSLIACLSALVVSAIVMLWTANRWAPFVPGFFFGPAILKMVAALVLYPDSYYSSHSMPRMELAELLVFSIGVVALTFRFVGKRPAMTTFFDRIALTLFAFTALSWLFTPYRFPPWRLLFGGIALLIAWCAHHFPRTPRRRGHQARGAGSAVIVRGRS